MIREAIYAAPEQWHVDLYVFARAMTCDCGHIHRAGQVTHCFRSDGYPRDDVRDTYLPFAICDGCNDVPLNWIAR